MCQLRAVESLAIFMFTTKMTFCEQPFLGTYAVLECMSHMLDVQIREEALKRPEPKKKNLWRRPRSMVQKGHILQRRNEKKKYILLTRKGRQEILRVIQLPLQSGHSASINIGKEIRKRLFMENVGEEKLERDQIFGRLIRN